MNLAPLKSTVIDSAVLSTTVTFIGQHFLTSGIFVQYFPPITILKPYLAMSGISMIVLSLFCLIVMPDRDLCKFTKDYLVLYNRHNRDECSLIYWDEVVSWHYEWYKTYDQLVIEMIDGSTEIQDMYSIGSIKKSMDHHIPGKMKKNKHFRKDQR